jgi:hypothetical protein
MISPIYGICIKAQYALVHCAVNGDGSEQHARSGAHLLHLSPLGPTSHRTLAFAHVLQALGSRSLAVLELMSRGQ